MSVDDRERDLMARFARLREEDCASAPSFEALRRRPRRAAPVLRVRTLVASAAVIAVAAFGANRALHHGGAERGAPAAGVPSPSGLKLERWSAPTDFLLDVPGGEVFRTLPAIGRTSGWELHPRASDGSARNYLIKQGMST